MSPSAKNFAEAAEAALRLADECEDAAGKYDDAWRAHCEAEADRHRERARHWLERKALLEAQVSYV